MTESVGGRLTHQVGGLDPERLSQASQRRHSGFFAGLEQADRGTGHIGQFGELVLGKRAIGAQAAQVGGGARGRPGHLVRRQGTGIGRQTGATRAIDGRHGSHYDMELSRACLVHWWCLFNDRVRRSQECLHDERPFYYSPDGSDPRLGVLRRRWTRNSK